MANNIDDLSDDIISHILSFLSIRDTLRARLSSPRWLNLHDSRSVITLNSVTVLGKESLDGYNSPAVQSQFMEIATRFMQLWSGNRMITLIIRYALHEEHFEQLENLIAKAFSMKVECIEISLVRLFEQRPIFPCSAIQRRHNPYLRRLWLNHCAPSLLDFGCVSWLSNLTTLRLAGMPLDLERRIDLILCSATNLVELGLIQCNLGKLRIDDGQLLHLKKLEITDSLMEVRLNCPSLEVFDYYGRLRSLRFVHVPVLRKAKIVLNEREICSVLFNDIDIQAPSIQELSIRIGTEIRPAPPSLARHSLKKLKVVLVGGFDLLSIKYLLNASPCLEELVVQVAFLHDNGINPEIGAIGRREYWDQRKHHKLKKVKFYRFCEHWNAMKLAKYILRNAVALDEMEIVIDSLPYVIEYFQSLRILKEKVNPTARFIVSHC